MELSEHLLLHEADLMLRLLRIGCAAEASLAGALDELERDLRRAGELPPASAAELLALLGIAHDRLLIARLIQPAGPGLYRTTGEGAAALVAHPMGVDSSVLAAIPAYRAFLERTARRHATPNAEDAADAADALPPEYTQGYAAFQAGGRLEENPYEWDSARHLEWENGWMEARDEASP